MPSSEAIALPDYQISDLRERPEFASAVADRIWRAWWRTKGVPLDHITVRVSENFVSNGIPFALVAHQGDRFLGTASVISQDMAERPQYSPWVAAVWVDTEYRRVGIGSSLVKAAAQAAFDLHVNHVFLCATAVNSGFYERMGWQRVEQNVDGLNILSFSRTG